MNKLAIDVELVVASLHLPVEVHAHEARGYCPMHKERTGKEDSNPSWWVNLETGMHMCFSCHYKGNLMQLICDVNGFYQESWGGDKGFDYKAAEEWLSGITNIRPERMMEILKSLPNYIKAKPKPLEMSEARLAVFSLPPDEVLKSRNITVASAEKYEILWEDSKKNWILPLRNPESKALLGWQEKGTINRTFYNRPAGLQKSKTLFGVKNQTESRVVVVESPLDCARMHSAGVDSVVAICGSMMSAEQLKLIRASETIICAFDNPNIDAAGLKASQEMREAARKFGLNLFFFNYGDSNKKDPGDLTNEEIVWGIENAKSYVLGEKAYVSGNAQAVPS